MDHLPSLLSPFILMLYYFPPSHIVPLRLRFSFSVVPSLDAGGTLVLVFIPTWLTNKLLTVILTITTLSAMFLSQSGHSALLLT